MDYRQRLVRVPNICHGALTVKGTRILVSTIAACRESGATVGEILDSYPTLSPEDIRAVDEFIAAQWTRWPQRARLRLRR
jgi:uncharacterized protein (DUF433 family)